MARAAPPPLLRSRIYPLVEPWAAAPGLVVPVLRFILPAGIGSTGQPEKGFSGSVAVLMPELPFSVLPFAFRDFAAAGTPETWRTRPVPPWRGVPCSLGTVAIRFPNELVPDEPRTFNALVLVPDREPPGPRLLNVLLGTEFLRHYGMRILISYDAITYSTEEDAERGVDSSIACGYLEKA